MSKQEVRDEAKQAEVNPEVKGAIKQRQMKLSRSRMMAAVARRRRRARQPDPHRRRPQVRARAASPPRSWPRAPASSPQKIREKAAEAGVPVLRNVPLARALHGSCKIGDSIPIELFRAVAEVLATVYATKRRRGGNFPQVPRQRRFRAPRPGCWHRSGSRDLANR